MVSKMYVYIQHFILSTMSMYVFLGIAIMYVTYQMFTATLLLC